MPQPIANIWVVRAGLGAHLTELFEQAAVAGLGGPPARDVGDLETSEIAGLICAEAAMPRPRALSLAEVLRRFVHEPQVGDLVVTPTASTAAVLVGEFVSGYRYRSEEHTSELQSRQYL